MEPWFQVHEAHTRPASSSLVDCADGEDRVGGKTPMKEKPRNTSLGSQSTCEAGEDGEYEAVGSPIMPKMRRRSTDSIFELAEDREHEAAGSSIMSKTRRRSTEDSISESAEEEEAMYMFLRTTSASSDAAEPEAAEGMVRAARTHERTHSVLSIPDEYSTSSEQAPALQRRSSSKTVFPAPSWPPVYDPCDPAWIQPASSREALEQEAVLLRRQMAQLERAVELRKSREPSSAVLEGYRQNIVEMRSRAWRLEVQLRRAYAEHGGTHDDPTSVEHPLATGFDHQPQGEPNEASWAAWASGEPLLAKLFRHALGA